MDLIIVESPTKAKTLHRFLGKEYSVEATRGHIKDLPKSKLGINIEKHFAPEYDVIPKQSETIKNLTGEAKKASKIYIATDPDREGEAIAMHVKEVLLDSKPKISKEKLSRIVFHEITKGAVEEAIKNPRDVDENLVNAQTGRRVLDRLVGYKLSPLLWKKVRIGLSAGRVQSVAVRLIVEKEKEIGKFKAVEYWEIFCVVKTKGAKKDEFSIQLVRVNGKNAEVKNKKEADEILSYLKKAEYIVQNVRKEEIRKRAYAPFTTSTMTQSAARLFFWSAKKTMSIAQRLYEEGLITYHRTDSTNIAGIAIKSARGYIEKEYGPKYLPEKPNFFKTSSKVAQEAHEAIRPTSITSKFDIEDGKFVKEAEKLYSLIWKRFVACQMSESIYDQTTIDVNAGPKDYGLRAGGQIMKFDGWRKVYGRSRSTGEEELVALPEVNISDPLDLKDVRGDQKFTQPPARFTEASLIKTLEKLEIGRPSTYAPTISTIQVRQYVEKKEGKFFPTNIGIAVNDFLVTNFPEEMDYSFTAKMENDLDEVANGKTKWNQEVEDFWKPFSKKLESVDKNSKRVKIEVEKLGKECPLCKKGELVIRVGRFGKFVSCSRFPDCKYTEKYVEKIDVKCPECKVGDVIVKKTGKGRTFYGCSRYPECKFASWTKPGAKTSEKKSTSE